jgi:hypothetical protein
MWFKVQESETIISPKRIGAKRRVGIETPLQIFPGIPGTPLSTVPGRSRRRNGLVVPRRVALWMSGCPMQMKGSFLSKLKRSL